MIRTAPRWAAGLLLGSVLASAGLTAVSPSAGATPLGDARTRAAALRHQVDDLRDRAEAATEAYDESYSKLGAAVNAHLEAEQALEAAQAASGTSDDQRALRARALYMSGGATVLYAAVLESGSITDVTNRIHQVQAVLQGDSLAVNKADTAVASLQAAQDRLAQTAKQATQLQDKVSDQADKVRDLLNRTNALLASADANVRNLAEQQRQAAAAAAAAAAARELAVARGTTGTLPNVPASPLAAAALAFAQAQLGKPYVWGATGPDSYDCSGLTGAAYAAAGLILPRTSREQWYAGPHVNLGDLEPGDLLFWAYDPTNPATIHHVALYAGEGLMVAAPHTGDVVKVQPIYLGGYIGAVRPGVTAVATPAASPTEASVPNAP